MFCIHHTTTWFLQLSFVQHKLCTMYPWLGGYLSSAVKMWRFCKFRTIEKGRALHGPYSNASMEDG